MSANLTDLFNLQLAQQAMLYNLRHLKDRKRNSERVATFFLHAIDLLPVTASLEIGAHEATFSRKAKKAHHELNARAFEANPNVYAHFLFDQSLGDSGIEYKYSAIGDRDGETSFHIYQSVMGKDEPADSRRQSCLLRADSPEDSHYPVTVPMATLDSICAGDDSQSLYALWIDAEGFGLQVLKGANAVLKRTLAIYIELESIAKFAGQALDRDIMAFLLERDFIPILRDFQFNHQYNVIFIRKDYVPEIEHEWHRYFQAVLAVELDGRKNPELLAGESYKIAPPELKRLRLDSEAELKDAIHELPLLRAPADGLDPVKRVVVCHISDLDEARAFYKKNCRREPKFYVLGLANAGQCARGGDLHDFSQLRPGMDMQLFFKRARRPGRTNFSTLVNVLAHRGIYSFHIEQYCVAGFWQRNFGEKMGQQQWETARLFFNTLADAWSQYTYLAICHANAVGQPGYIPLAPYDQYNHPLVHAVSGDIVCEGGLEFYVDGNIIHSTTLDFFNSMNGCGKIYGFEPVPATFERLKNLCADIPNLVLEKQALWSNSGHLHLAGMESPNCAHAAQTGSKGDNCACTSIDDYFAGREKPTLIKLDVEGAEPEVIIGASELLSRNKPELMLAIYHACNGMDWLTVPELLMKHATGYELFCGHHRPWYAESFVYGK